MYQTWSWISFLHWSYEPPVLQRLLPGGLRPHTFDGRAWVGLTPFFLQDLRTPVAPALPWFTSFPETNVRTYVRGPDGREGLWFFSLDAARLEPVLVARSTYALPYMWSQMTVQRDGPTIRYRSRRRWPCPTSATSGITLEVGDPLSPEELDDFDHYLTALAALHHPRAAAGAVRLSSTSPGRCTRRSSTSWRQIWSPPPGYPPHRGSRWCTGRPACGPGSAPCARSDEPDRLALRRPLPGVGEILSVAESVGESAQRGFQLARDRAALAQDPR
jgi:uncharacterized protein YqjF (DUF2071 family)